MLQMSNGDVTDLCMREGVGLICRGGKWVGLGQIVSGHSETQLVLDPFYKWADICESVPLVDWVGLTHFDPFLMWIKAGQP